MNTLALKDLLFKMADDALIIGHRNSEWTGIGPMLEEDLAFSSMSQDKIGHAQAIYNLLDDLGEADADTLAFKRAEKDFRCCQFTELPIGEYDFSIIRQFLFDNAELIRYDMLIHSSYLPISLLAKKVKGEIKYHVMHGDTFVKQLGKGTEESHARMQSALNFAWPYALGIFEKSEHESSLISENIFGGEDELKKRWLEKISPVIAAANLTLPSIDDSKVVYGGRKGFHSEFLSPLLDEMCEVTRSDEATAEW